MRQTLFAAGWTVAVGEKEGVFRVNGLTHGVLYLFAPFVPPDCQLSRQPPSSLFRLSSNYIYPEKRRESHSAGTWRPKCNKAHPRRAQRLWAALVYNNPPTPSSRSRRNGGATYGRHANDRILKAPSNAEKGIKKIGVTVS